ncbi:MAG: response regulator [Lachnospiraceae bacterium]|nr:response regulator [Lachnospiraceae bacterium]
MDINVQIREITDRNAVKINSILSKAVLVFLILCPVVILINSAGITEYSVRQLVEINAVLLVFSVLPSIFVSRSYDDNSNRFVILACMEIVVCLLVINPVINVAMLYILVPIVSLVYLRRDIFVSVARNCFFVLLIMEAVKFYGYIRSATDLTLNSLYEQSYESLIPTVLGYVIVMVTIYLVFGWLRDVLVSVFVEQLETDKDKGQKLVPVVAEVEEEKDTVYNVKGLFLAVNQTVQGLIRGKDKSLVVNVDYDLPAQLKGKPEQLKLALVNILSDFLQFTEQGTVTLSVTYEKGITPRKGQNMTVICRILCSEDLTDGLREGITMGFALAKNIITGMGGIILDKTFGHAMRQTCYTISYLQEVADEETLMMVKQKNRSEQENLITVSQKKAQDSLFGRQVKALVADDSPENQRLLKAILKSFGVTATCVSSGQEAIEKLQTRGYDFVILDHMMPQKGGIQTAKEIRQMDEPYFELLPLMVMSSNVNEEFKKIFTDSGFTEIISKPIKAEELRLAISRIYLQ